MMGELMADACTGGAVNHGEPPETNSFVHLTSLHKKATPWVRLLQHKGFGLTDNPPISSLMLGMAAHIEVQT